MRLRVAGNVELEVAEEPIVVVDQGQDPFSLPGRRPHARREAYGGGAARRVSGTVAHRLRAVKTARPIGSGRASCPVAGVVLVRRRPG